LAHLPTYVVKIATYPVDCWLATELPFNQTEQAMKRYVIERSIPGVGKLSPEQLKGAAATSNEALAKLPGKVQWEHSYVVDDKTFCIYLAENEAAVKEHAQLSGFPANKITEVCTIIDPLTAHR
jgi:Protein of unknown function (DUF4242)